MFIIYTLQRYNISVIQQNISLVISKSSSILFEIRY